MTPDEEARISQKQKRAEAASWILAIPVGLVIAAALIALMWVLGGTQIYLGAFIWPVVIVSVVISSVLVGRVYRKHMERKLGRRLKGEYELTSLSSWMEVSTKEASQESNRKEGEARPDPR